MRAPWITISVGIAALAITPAASAEYYYSEHGARKIVKDYVTKHYGYPISVIGTACRPQGLNAATPGFVYHRWVCGWVHGATTCEGAVRIIGSRNRGTYYGKTVVGYSCDPGPSAPAPVPAPTPPRPAPTPGGCNPNYTGACMNLPGDYDCLGGTGDGPNYVAGPVTVVGVDVYGLDGDGNGIGCQ